MNEPGNDMVYVDAAEMKSLFCTILMRYGVPKNDAGLVAQTITESSVDGVYTHGVNRFARLIKNIKDGIVSLHVYPEKVSYFGGLEQWNGGSGIGIINALQCTERAMELASQKGIGCLALANTNHWLRGGSYGWKAAKAGFVFIGWTNTIANMPAWNATDNRLGNNPIVFAIPFNEEAIVLDMAVSQFSYGMLELSAMKGEKLPVAGGFDADGNVTDDPTKIIESKLPLPIGYWKGAGLSLVLDILATILSAGDSTAQITGKGEEQGLSQIFICIDLKKLQNFNVIHNTIEGIIKDYQDSKVATGKSIQYPGERVLATRKRNMKSGIPVVKTIWEEIVALQYNS